MEELAPLAVQVAKAAGADYADARFVRQREEQVHVKNGAVTGLSASRSQGIGIRVIAGGAWGFAGTSNLDKRSVTEAAQLAVRIARASATTAKAPVVLSEVEPVRARIGHTAQRDPFAVPLEQRINLLLECDQAMHGAEQVKVRSGFLRCVGEEKLFVSSEGSEIWQERIETGGGVDARAVSADGSDTQVRSYPSSHGGNMGSRGWEMIEEMELVDNAERVAGEAVELLEAPPCPSGVKDIILEGSQLALQVHESCGHPIELDRVLGMEAGYAGTSFLTTEKLGNFRYGSDIVNINADATVPGGLGSFAYDDEGVPGQRTPIIEKGMFVGYLSSRETASQIGLKSSGAMRADGYSRIPLVRMTNVNLEPGDATLQEIIEDTQDGLYLLTNTSWSIDDRRLNFQFGTQMAYEIKNGKLGQLLKNATYSGITPQFWQSCDAIGNRDEWMMWGVPNCGKGEPGQTAHVGHGASCARFRNVHVGVMKS